MRPVPSAPAVPLSSRPLARLACLLALSASPMLLQAERTWGQAPTRIVVSNPNDANARVALHRPSGQQLSNIEPTMTFDGVSGISRCLTLSALHTALTSAGSDAVQPDSPMPLTPSGLMVPKVVCSAMVMSLIQPALGIGTGVVPLDAGWSDLGAWDALWQALPHDGAGNARDIAVVVGAPDVDDAVAVDAIGVDQQLAVARHEGADRGLGRKDFRL